MTDQTPETGDTTTTLDEALEAGYLGTHPDPEPNESYTVEGVTSGDSGGSESPPPDPPASKSTASKSSSGSKASSS